MSWRQSHYKLSNMSDEEIYALIDSVTSDDDTGSETDGDFDDDEDDVVDSEKNCRHDLADIDDPSEPTASSLRKLSTFAETSTSTATALSDNTFDIPVATQFATCAEMSTDILNTNGIDNPSEPTASPLRNPSTFAETSTCTGTALSDSTFYKPVACAEQFKMRKRKVVSELQEEEGGPTISTCGQFSDAINIKDIKNTSLEFKKMVWRKRNLQLHVNELVFHGVKEMPAELKELKTPYDCFRYFVTDDLLQFLAEQMNLYARQGNIKTRFTTNGIELRKFIGILFFMSVYRYPNVRSYWGKHSFEAVRQAMTCRRFEEMRKFLHFNDNAGAVARGAHGYDALYKLRPLVTHFNERFGSVPMRQRLVVDEQMCGTKMGGNPTRQYMPKKPHKWGTKVFALCDDGGFSYSFEIYSGAGDNVILENTPDLGAASNVVVRLSKKIPDNINHIVYFDNFYTSLGLLTYLRSRGIYSLGTVRENRVPNIKLSTEAELTQRKAERGYSEEYVGTAYGIDISSVLWRDTKTVRLLSTYIGVKPFLSKKTDLQPQKAKRWDAKTKQRKEIDCPFIITEYNQHMGGVDIMDGLIGRYHIRMKTRKWTNRLFFHLLDMAMVNAYILYHRLQRERTQLPNFRTAVAESLCLAGVAQGKRSVGRPVLQSPILPKPKRAYIPTDDVRYDNIGHWCAFHDRSGKKTCKFPGCKSETQAYCTKCNLNLCNSPAKTCFLAFHQRK